MDQLSIVRKNLPIPFVMSGLGHEPVSNDGTRLLYHSPFRRDKTPSFDVWLDDEKGWRWGDRPEGTQGGAIDLVQRFNNSSDAVAIEQASELYIEFIGSDYQAPDISVAAKTSFNSDTAVERIELGRDGVLGAVLDMQHGMEETHPAVASIPANDLIDQWRLSSYSGGVLLPNYDEHDALVGYKRRASDGSKKNAPGNGQELYGLWRVSDDTGPVFLVEGETDAWSAHHWIEDHTVMGVLGAGVMPEKTGAERLAGRDVVICFDGDPAGIEATKKWASYLESLRCNVTVVTLPTGRDVSSLRHQEVRDLPSRAKAALLPPDNFETVGSAYFKGDKRVSNWALDVERMLRSEDGNAAFEGVLLPSGKRVVLPAHDLGTGQRLITWCTAHGVSWSGTGVDTQLLLQHLQHLAFFLPEGRMTDRVGYHQGDIVWHDGHIGTDDWTYVPPVNSIDVPSMLHIVDKPVDPVKVIDALLETYSHDVVTPILGWLAVAPLRPMFDRFPSLVISGASGTGKTTLVEALLSVFSGSSINATLTSTTAHAVASFFASSNGFPVWFDEYRPGARPDAKGQLDQQARDAYTGQKSYKGGMHDNKQALGQYESDTPIVITGEDSVIETSLTDRSILLRLTRDRKGSLSAITSTDYEGFAYNYLTWVQGVTVVNHHPSGPKELNDRQRINIGVIEAGYQLLRNYLLDHDPMYALPPLDLTLVVGMADQARNESPILDAIKWALDSELNCVWQDKERTYVSVSQLLIDANRAGTFILPVSNVQGLTGTIIDLYDAKSERHRAPSGGNPRRVLVISNEMVD